MIESYDATKEARAIATQMAFAPTATFQAYLTEQARVCYIQTFDYESIGTYTNPGWHNTNCYSRTKMDNIYIFEGELLRVIGRTQGEINDTLWWQFEKEGIYCWVSSELVIESDPSNCLNVNVTADFLPD